MSYSYVFVGNSKVIKMRKNITIKELFLFIFPIFAICVLPKPLVIFLIIKKTFNWILLKNTFLECQSFFRKFLWTFVSFQTSNLWSSSVRRRRTWRTSTTIWFISKSYDESTTMSTNAMSTHAVPALLLYSNDASTTTSPTTTKFWPSTWTLLPMLYSKYFYSYNI